MTDRMPDPDARLYSCRNFQTTMPLPRWTSLGRWRRERLRIRRHLRLCAGLNAETAAFKARGRIVNLFEHEGVVVENLCIETLPGLYLVGNLYRPAGAKGRLPLILHPHGHGMNSRTLPLSFASVPHRALNTALLGFASFAYSMIGYDDDTRQLPHRGALLTGPHKQVANTLGLSLFGLQLNNSIKALDYLLSRRDIDPRRVGCTGESGGGTQTYFLAALDDRVQVAAPAVMLSGHFQGGCECENAPALHLRYSNLHYAALIAPRPLLLLGCTGDWTHHQEDRELPALRNLYELYGREEAVDGFYQDDKHNYNQASREAVYAWMVRWLRHRGRGGDQPQESARSVPERSQLLVFDGPIPPYKGAIRSVKPLISTWRKLHARPGDPDDVADALQLDWPARADILIRNQPPRYEYRVGREKLHAIEFGRFSQDSSIRCRFLVPSRRGSRTILLLRSYADATAWDRFTTRMQPELRRLADTGCGILVPRLFGQSGADEVATFREHYHRYLATTYDRTEHQHQLDDIVTTVRMAQVEMGINPASITIVAGADLGLLALAAWSFLRARTAVGPLVADLGDADLRAPATWVRRAYLPLVLGTGGVAALARLAGDGGNGRLSGVRATDRASMPKGLRVVAARSPFTRLLETAAENWL